MSNESLFIAIPSYKEFDESRVRSAPPGHRFGLYFKGWTRKWELDKKRKKDMLDRVATLDMDYFTLVRSIRDRQLFLAFEKKEMTFIKGKRGGASFVTGMGLEHPVENGFAFLHPYGIPYLPGSSVKGVVRRAAEEISLFMQNPPWTLLDVWWLFGYDAKSGYFSWKEEREGNVSGLIEEGKKWREAYLEWAKKTNPEEILAFLKTAVPSDEASMWEGSPEHFLLRLLDDQKLSRQIHLKGSLSFWDVIPSVNAETLKVDVINPHYSTYYKAGGTGERRENAWPGDWENPKPVFYLTLPKGTKYRFICRMEPVTSLPVRLLESWKDLLEKAFEEAFVGFGFGAKTSQGYGLMEDDPDEGKEIEEMSRREEEEQERMKQQREEEEKRRQWESLSPIERLLSELEELEDDPRIHAIYNEELGKYDGEEKIRLALALKETYMRLGKWSGDISKKQQKKVEKLKKILGEAQ